MKRKKPRITKLAPKQRERLRRAIAEEEANAEDTKAQAREVFERLEQIDRVVDLLVEARRAKGVTAADVARRIGMAPSNISRLEGSSSRRPNPTLDTLLAYAEAVGVELRVAVTKPKVRNRGAA